MAKPNQPRKQIHIRARKRRQFREYIEFDSWRNRFDKSYKDQLKNQLRSTIIIDEITDHDSNIFW